MAAPAEGIAVTISANEPRAGRRRSAIPTVLFVPWTGLATSSVYGAAIKPRSLADPVIGSVARWSATMQGPTQELLLWRGSHPNEPAITSLKLRDVREMGKKMGQSGGTLVLPIHSFRRSSHSKTRMTNGNESFAQVAHPLSRAAVVQATRIIVLSMQSLLTDAASMCAATCILRWDRHPLGNACSRRNCRSS